jgi:hypothetical protein
MTFTVHYRINEQPNGHTHMRLCETEAEALRVGRELMDKDGCRVAFISDARDECLRDPGRSSQEWR